MASMFPLGPVGQGIIKALICGFVRRKLSIGNVRERTTRNAKNVAFLEFSGQGDDIVVKKSKFPSVPELCRILAHAALLEGFRHFSEEAFIPLRQNGEFRVGLLVHIFNKQTYLSIYMPMLHCMCYI